MKSKFTAYDGKEFINEDECLEYEMKCYKKEYNKYKSELLKIATKVKMDPSNDLLEDFDLSDDAVGYRVDLSDITNKSDIEVVRNFIEYFEKYYESYSECESNHSYSIDTNLYDYDEIQMGDIYLLIIDELTHSHRDCIDSRECIYTTSYSYNHNLIIVSYETMKDNYLSEFKKNTKGIFYN